MRDTMTKADLLSMIDAIERQPKPKKTLVYIPAWLDANTDQRTPVIIEELIGDTKSIVRPCAKDKQPSFEVLNDRLTYV